MKKIEGGITAAKGFEAAGVNAGIKYKTLCCCRRIHY